MRMENLNTKLINTFRVLVFFDKSAARQMFNHRITQNALTLSR